MSNVSYELLKSLMGQKTGDGIATLVDGKIPADQLALTDTNVYLGEYTDLTTLAANHASAPYGYYATVAGVIHYYNTAMDPVGWTSENIVESKYKTLSDSAKNGQPDWTVIPG